jgi:hypothetical protein
MRRAGERLRQEHDVGMLAFISAMHHSQKANGLVCGLSTRKMRTPCSIQNSKTSGSSSHRAPRPVVGLEVERVDVLVLLGRVLGVLDRAVGPLRNHSGCSCTQGGRAPLERDVEGDLDAASLAPPGDERLEGRRGAEVGVDGRVPALGGADGPRAADVVGLGRRSP